MIEEIEVTGAGRWVWGGGGGGRGGDFFAALFSDLLIGCQEGKNK